MPWGLFALVFVISVAVGRGVAARKQRLAQRAREQKDMN